MIEERGCKLEYLPPYSPDYNPIEYSFSVIKKSLKGRHQLQGSESLDELALKTLDIAQTVITGEIARNQFRHCKIRLDEDL